MIGFIREGIVSMVKKVFLLVLMFLLFTSLMVSAKETIKYTTIKKVGDLGKYVGKKVIVEGKISNVMWQHIMGSFSSHPWHYYFDIDKSQIVLYTKEKIEKKGKIKVAGEVVELRGGGAPKGKKTKVDESYVEYHILVDKVIK